MSGGGGHLVGTQNSPLIHSFDVVTPFGGVLLEPPGDAVWDRTLLSVEPFIFPDRSCDNKEATAGGVSRQLWGEGGGER